MSKESDVRQAAAKLDEAIAAGAAAGLRITWPGAPKPIAAVLRISETAAAVPPTRQASPADLPRKGGGVRGRR